jgi:hypothetical protein
MGVGVRVGVGVGVGGVGVGVCMAEQGDEMATMIMMMTMAHVPRIMASGEFHPR